ncbi:MAG: HIG1 domain-containing protein [Proteobacteria bacterium]|nr:HIG1 domain-containing protein [Pseudomonadota bacterium]MDE2412421.1 HIG1 domain-containing protein [Sphingomonadales bacterium]
MKIFLALVIVALMIGVVVSLVRGIAAFLQSTREDLLHDRSTGPSAMQLKQNKMMMQRILFQGAAILVVAILLFAAR